MMEEALSSDAAGQSNSIIDVDRFLKEISRSTAEGRLRSKRRVASTSPRRVREYRT